MTKAAKKKEKGWPHKIYSVPVRDMRVPSAGIAQRRFLQAQAEEYAANFDPDKFGTPVVNWRDRIYWIIDGQHRIAALKLFFGKSDPGTITCVVYSDLNDAEMAELFLGLNTRRPVNRFDSFQVACTAERALESEIKRVVEANGLTIKQSKDPECIGAVSALIKAADFAGTNVLGQALRVLKNGLAGDPLAFDGALIVGSAHVFNRFNGHTQEQRFVQTLATVNQGGAAILRRARAMREQTGNDKAQCVSAVLVEIYNKGLRAGDKTRLPSWWKSMADEPQKADNS